jgi:outer membrane lipoprotein carrier protein
MKKIISVFISILFLGLIAMAQPPKGMGTNDPAAKKVLDGVSAKFKSYKTVQAKFNFKAENGSGKVLGTKSGTVYMKGTKYRMTVTGQEVFCDGVNVWTYDKLANEVTITKFDGSANTITPQKIFTNFYDKDFLYRLSADAKTTQEIELTPVDKSKPFHKVLLTVSKTSQSISSVKWFEKTGNRTTITVSSITPNGAIADTQFGFDAKKYPGVDVVDLR